MVAYPIQHLLEKNKAVLWPSSDSSFFQKTMRKIENFSDYVIGHDVIGHDVIGDPVAPTDNSGLDLFAIQNRLIIRYLDKKLWPF